MSSDLTVSGTKYTVHRWSADRTEFVANALARRVVAQSSFQARREMIVNTAYSVSLPRTRPFGRGGIVLSDDGEARFAPAVKSATIRPYREMAEWPIAPVA